MKLTNATDLQTRVSEGRTDAPRRQREAAARARPSCDSPVSHCVWVRAACGLAVVAGAAAAQEHPHAAKGFALDKMFAGTDFDAINTFNGNLVLTIPIGSAFPLREGFAYRLTLVGNSAIWESESRPNPVPTVIQRLSPLFNAGVGWRLSLGELRPAFDTVPTTYVDEEGGEHQFYSTLHPSDPEDPGDSLAGQNVQYTRDGSYLRLKREGTATVVESGDGAHRVFDGGNRLQRIEDRFGNYVAITYVPTPLGEDWHLNDSVGRAHYLRFRTNPFDQTIVNGQQVPLFRQTLFEVDLAGFAGQRSVWRLEHTQTNLPRAAPDSAGHPLNNATTPDTLSVPFLTRIVQPDGATWDLPLATSYLLTSIGFEPDHVGMIRRITLPSRGSVEWDHGNYSFPLDFEPEGPPHGEHRRVKTSSRGVYARRQIRANGSVEGEWVYSPSLVLEPPVSGQPRTWLEAVRTERTPLGHYVRHYYSVYPRRTGYPPFPDADVLEYGLPLTCKVKEGSLFLSQRIYAGDPDGPPVNGVPAEQWYRLRSVYVSYERDQGGAGVTGRAEQAGGRLNRRLSVSRTVLEDDPVNTAPLVSRYIQVSNTDFDGVGQYRVATTTSNFENSPLRVERVQYNPERGTYQLDAQGLPLPGYNPLPSSAPWLLTHRTFEERQEGNQTALTEMCMDPATGFLSRMRIHAFGSNAAANDIVIDRVPELRGNGTKTGNVARELWFGGDLQSVALLGQSTCSQTLAATNAVYSRRHTYAGGVRETSRWLNASGADLPFKTLDRTIDVATGLSSSDRDVAGLATDFSYDAMGRVTSIHPQAGHGAWTEIVYVPGGGSTPPELHVLSRDNGFGSASGGDVAQSINGGAMAEHQTHFDGFGRVALERTRMPDGTWSNRTTTYDGAGNVAAVSERQSGTPSKFTQFLEYDAFGRALKIRPPDGGAHEVTVGWAGTRRKTTSSKIWRPCGSDIQPSECPTEVYENYDAYGRLVQVQEASRPGALLAVTSYAYDVGDRLSSVTQGAQSRTLFHDRRGFLLFESHPELGVSGNGGMSYVDYDPLGNPGQVVDDAHAVRFVRDRAGRLREVQENLGGGSFRKLKEWHYGSSFDPATWKLGKVIEQSGWNYVRLGATDYVVRLRETFEYGGRGGARSRRRLENYTHTSINPPPASPSEAFEQGWEYDALGNVVEIEYPTCVHATCTVPEPLTLANAYSQGLLVAVKDYADPITYHPNGTVHQVAHTNEVVDTYALDPNSMARPRSIEARLGSTFLWNSGNYSYDGSGNIKSIGSWSFQYDAVARLVSASLNDGVLGGGFTKTQNYVFDQFGNLTEIRAQTAVTPGRVIPVSAATNRLTGGGVAYDASGNLTSLNGASYSWDALDRMWRMQNGAEEWIYLYTADDERAWSFKAGGTLSRWTLRGLRNEVLREYEANTLTGTWQVANTFIYRDGSLLASACPNCETLNYSLDHLGSPRLVTGEGGVVGAYHVYYPFGEELTAFDQDSQRLKFTGHERDLASLATPADDLDYMHARFHSPLTGRFLSVDPAAADLRRPQTWNRYAYAFGNPIRFTDPDGRYPPVGNSPWQIGKWLVELFDGDLHGREKHYHIRDRKARNTTARVGMDGVPFKKGNTVNVPKGLLDKMKKGGFFLTIVTSVVSGILTHAEASQVDKNNPDEVKSFLAPILFGKNLDELDATERGKLDEVWKKMQEDKRKEEDEAKRRQEAESRRADGARVR